MDILNFPTNAQPQKCILFKAWTILFQMLFNFFKYLHYFKRYDFCNETWQKAPLCVELLCQYHERAMVRDTKDLFAFIHWMVLTIATCGFPVKYKATTLLRLNSRITFCSKQLSSKCFSNLVNNIISFHWNKSVSCRTSGLEMTAVWSWLQFFHLAIESKKCQIYN